MQIDNFECEQIVIRQYIRLRLQKLCAKATDNEIVRLPYLIYLYCKDIFKRQRLANQFLLHIFKEVFYFKDVEQPYSQNQDELSLLYCKVVQLWANNKVLCLAQLVLRCVLLGLSIKIGQKDTKKFKKNFKKLVNSLQIQLVLNEGESLSQVILKELENMRQQFQDLEYFQQLKLAFQKCDVLKVDRWLEDVLVQKRRAFQLKSESFLPFQTQENKMQVQNKQSTKITKSINDQKTQAENKQKSNGKVELHTLTKKHCTDRNKTVQKDHGLLESQNKKEKIACIKLANKLRQSMPGPAPRFSSKYVFKSTKKCNTQQLPEEETSETSYSTSNHCNFASYPTNKSTISPPNVRVEQEDSKYLCAATPPRRNASHLQD